ncbi:hypothetical protein QCN27_19740 [Cereibacter sp. SYSU M97828]|nr:hypothetical protein [Cereibacter flavus]
MKENCEKPSEVDARKIAQGLTLDGEGRRLLAKWDAYLADLGNPIPDVDEFEGFGSKANLVRLRRVLAIARPGLLKPIRLALISKSSEEWKRARRNIDAPPEKPKEVPRLSLPESDLPPAWIAALSDMRRAMAAKESGGLMLDPRNPPTKKSLGTMVGALRAFGKACRDCDQAIQLTPSTVDIYRETMSLRGNKRITIAARLKDLGFFAAWVDASPIVREHIDRNFRRYRRASNSDPKNKDIWFRDNPITLSEVWDRAEEKLAAYHGGNPGTARAAWNLLDAVCLALSVVCPLRVGDLHRIEFGTHLVRHDGYWSLDIVTQKTGLAYHRDRLWPELTPFLDALAHMDLPVMPLHEACDRKLGTPIFSRKGDGRRTGDVWPSKCWRRNFGTGEHIVRSLWHTMMFESEEDDQWIALALCGQGNGRTAKHYTLEGRQKRAARRGRGLIAQKLVALKAGQGGRQVPFE